MHPTKLDVKHAQEGTMQAKASCNTHSSFHCVRVLMAGRHPLHTTNSWPCCYTGFPCCSDKPLSGWSCRGQECKHEEYEAWSFSVRAPQGQVGQRPKDPCTHPLGAADIMNYSYSMVWEKLPVKASANL